MFFQKAKSIFLEGKSNEPNTFAMFSKNFNATATEDIFLHIAGRTYYRLYINKAIVMHGPARCGHLHSRVDKLNISEYLVSGENLVEVEIAGYAAAFPVENDHTNEYSFMILEIFQNGESICHSDTDWDGKIIYHRDRVAQRHTHCRTIMELWRLDGNYPDLKNVKSEKLEIVDTPILWVRGVPYPTLEHVYTKNIISFGKTVANKTKPIAPPFFEAQDYFFSNTEERPATECMLEDEYPLDEGNLKWVDDSIVFASNCNNKFVTYDFKKLYCGFFCIDITLSESAVVDIIYSDRMEKDGTILSQQGYNTCVRLYCVEGKNSFTSFEPYAFRYAKIIIRSEKEISINKFGVLTYTTPDTQKGSFLCDDENINRIYEAAKLTMQLNTLDIFMDCPDRERSGWLCDSLWTARAARMMLGDCSVEKAMIENFLCYDADKTFSAFFPSCYPAEDCFLGCVILTWTFWFIIEIEEYYSRTGDRELVERYRERLNEFAKGAEALCGSHGLMESKNFIFVDWSLANETDYTAPISTAANSLYAYTLKVLDRLYGREDLSRRADEIYSTLKKNTLDLGNLDTRYIISDGLDIDEEGKLKQKQYFSEAAQFTNLWAGLFTKKEAPQLINAIVNELGPCPQNKPAKLDIAPANLFIGLCVRLDMLSRLGEQETLLREIRYLCDMMLKEGPGTFWETLGGTSSRCHGFASQMGVWLVTDILGLGIPCEVPKKTITISPHICGLKFAKGSIDTPYGMVSVSWSYNGDSFTLKISAPKEYNINLQLPKEIRGFEEICLNEKSIITGTKVIENLYGSVLLTAEE